MKQCGLKARDRVWTDAVGCRHQELDAISQEEGQNGDTSVFLIVCVGGKKKTQPKLTMFFSLFVLLFIAKYNFIRYTFINFTCERIGV